MEGGVENASSARAGKRGVTAANLPARARPRRMTQEERSAATRDALTNAAIGFFAEVGYAATTTRAIAQRARVSRGALQYHFPSWRDLVAATFEQLQSELARRFRFDMSIRAKPLEQRIDHIVEIYHQMLSSPFRRASLNIWLGVTGDPELRPVIRKMLRASLTAGNRAWRKVFADVEIDETDFRSLCRIVIMAVAGYAVGEGIEPDASWARDSGLLKEMFLRQLTSGRTAHRNSD
jgi:AcrR family transcriptional regulator